MSGRSQKVGMNGSSLRQTPYIWTYRPFKVEYSTLYSLEKLYISANFFNFFKGPGPLNSKNGRLNNSQCNMIKSSTQRCKKTQFRVVLCSNCIDNGRLQTAVVFDTAGGPYQNRIYWRVLTGIRIDRGKNHTSFPLAICIKKIRKTKSVQWFTDYFIKIVGGLFA